jgi:pyrroloquinoline quinone biosynthesis protein B
MVSSLGLVDHDKGAWFMMDASPDFPRQLKLLKTIVGGESDQPNGIFLTHAHIGHYTGLMFLGREAMSSSGVPVYVMPRMKYYLENNGPWNQLIALNNIKLRLISEQWSYNYEGRIKIEALLVPHRDEYSETVAFMITGPEKKALYIPDIDKWSRWNRSIDSLISEVDYALIDGTFFDGAELPGRDMNEIPHPFVVESMDLLSKLSKETRSKVYFIHLNHSNPLLKEHSNESRLVEQNGFHIARFNLRLSL